MTEAVLGIDIGTSGVRIAATSRDNRLLAMSAAPILAPLQNGGRIQQDPAIWWNALVEAFKGLDLSSLPIRAIAVDGTSGTILAIREDGSPAGLASMYNDVCEATQLALIAAVAPRETAALGSTSPLARAMEMRGAGSRILHQADWIVGELSGTYDVTDENNALKSGYDPVTRAWPDWIAKTGFDPSLFPRVVPAGTRIATIQPDMATQFGLSSDTAIVSGTTDGCAAFLASGASDPGDGVTSLGTTLTLKLLSDKPVFAPDFGIYSHRIGDQWLAGGASNTGGAAIGKFFSKDDLARLTPLLDPDHPTGLDYYPLPMPGERFPVNDPAFAPRLEPRPSDERVFFQAILEGIAHIEAEAYAKLGELGASRLASIRTAGGGASNPVWTKMRLRALGVPEKPSLSEHAAVGTARLAWRGIGHAN
ncbi:FGGY-family carbohydrate kinase [Aestuariivirga sp.]|uniref:FGGY-family carbohydrate kinase n=1 Tax=Aestuariivirga sp. TaxID=2650926 RepID=UPI003593AC4F